MENTGKRWGLVILGTFLLLVASLVAFVGLFVLAFAADGGVSTGMTMFAFILAVVFLIAWLGVRLIMKGNGMNIGIVRSESESKVRYTARVIGYLTLAGVLSSVSSRVDLLMAKFLNKGEPSVNLFGFVSLLLGWFIYYSIINKQWPITKKIVWIVIVFLGLYVVLPYLPFIIIRKLLSPIGTM